MNTKLHLKQLKFITLTATGLFFLLSVSSARVFLPSCFTDNMVLQQKTYTALWGKASPGKPVVIITSWNQKKYTALTDEQGKWKVKIATPSYGGPFTISFSQGEILTLKNILIGEVWFCSGQSNMEMPLAGWGKIINYEKEIGDANYPRVRLLQVVHNLSPLPGEEVQVTHDGWQECRPGSVAEFSSTAYFFARELYRTLKVPIGLIHSSWGGTVIQAWTSTHALKKLPEYKDAYSFKEQTDSVKNQLDYNVQLKSWIDLVDKEDTGYLQHFSESSSAIDEATWQVMRIPEFWENQSLPDLDGIVWFYQKINIPSSWAGKDATLSLGTIDNDDITWLNGKEIGQTKGWDLSRTYTIPGALLKAGENKLLIRVFDEGGGGGIYGDEKIPRLTSSTGESISLAGNWKYKIGLDLKSIRSKPISPNDPNRPSVLFNAMVHPFTQYAIRGVIWYQGEANVSHAAQYLKQFPLLIHDWRNHWHNGNLPFYFVQLANYLKKDSMPASSAWAELREAQLKTSSLPHTGMAVTIDIGEATDIHPKNKQEVGQRLAFIALAKTYHQKISFSGPAFESMKIEGNTGRIQFLTGEKKLTTKNNRPVMGFTIAGADQHFYPATAIIKGNEIWVSSPNVMHPVAVRYGWANNPDCNLINSQGLPASPFRTDNWNLSTQ